MKPQAVVFVLLLLASTAEARTERESEALAARRLGEPAGAPAMALAGDRKIARGSKIFIEPADGFEAYLTAAFLKKKTPVKVVSSRQQADYVLSSVVEARKIGWSQRKIFTQGDQTIDASVVVKDATSGEIIWAYNVHKASAVRGQQSPAEAVAKHLAKFIDDGGRETEFVVVGKVAKEQNEIVPMNDATVSRTSVAPTDQPSAGPGMTGSYEGEVRNETLGVSTGYKITVREENGGIYGCTTVQRPLSGSGGFHGSINGSRVVFETVGKKLRIRFIGELQGNEMKGTYTVLSTQEHGGFALKRISSDAPSVGFDTEHCPKD